MLTTLETQFMLQLKEQAYGGTLFTDDINPPSITANQKGGVISSLIKKGIIEVDPDYGQLGIVMADGETVFEITKEDVQDLIGRN